VPNAAVSVVEDWLLFGNNKELVIKAVETLKAKEALADQDDYAAVQKVIAQLGGGEDSFRHFTRSAESFELTYELMRQNKMPESESAMGKIINRLWSMGDEEEEDERDQAIDASKLPPFEQVRKYLAPAGAYVRSEADGWYVSGAMLAK